MGITAKLQDEESTDGNLLKGNLRGQGGFWLNWLDRILTEGRSGWADTKGKRWGIWSDIESDQISRTLAGLLKLDFKRKAVEDQIWGLVRKRAQRSMAKVWNKRDFVKWLSERWWKIRTVMLDSMSSGCKSQLLFVKYMREDLLNNVY